METGINPVVGTGSSAFVLNHLLQHGVLPACHAGLPACLWVGLQPDMRCLTGQRLSAWRPTCGCAAPGRQRRGTGLRDPHLL